MPFTRYEKAPRELREAKTMVWWDIKSCPVPEGYDPLLVRRSIESVLYQREYRGPLTIVAFGNLEDIPIEVLRAYSDTGIVMKHDPFVESSCTESQEGTSFSSIMKEVRRWIFFNKAPASIVFISNPKCVRLFRYQMMSLFPNTVYNILLAYETIPAEGFTPAPANLLWDWLLEGAKMDSAGKTIEEEFTGEPGGIFCAVCNSHSGVGIEDGDLTTHLTTETHQLEMFGKSAKPLFELDLRTALKWGAHRNIPPLKMFRLLRGHPEIKETGTEED